MLSLRKPREEALYDLVSGWRRGIFTAQEAHRCGYSTQLITHHVKSGTFVRLARGVYRLSLFPSDHLDGLVSALVRVDPERAIVSHESALQLHELSEVSPNVYNITLPRERRYRNSRARHSADVKIHTAAHIDPKEVVSVGGIRATSAARSIVDAAASSMDPKLVRSAVFDALRKFKATPSQILDAAERNAGPSVRRTIQDAVADARKGSGA